MNCCVHRLATVQEDCTTTMHNTVRNRSKGRKSWIPQKVKDSKRYLSREALLEYLRVWPDRCLDELAVYLADEFDTLVCISTISRELQRAGWSKKKNRQQARQRDPAIRDLYLYTVSPMRACQVFFVDESGLRSSSWLQA